MNGAGTDSWRAMDSGSPLGGVLAIEAQHRPEGSASTFGGSVKAAKVSGHIDATTNKTIACYAGLDLFTEYQPPAVEGLVNRAEINNLCDRTCVDRVIDCQNKGKRRGHPPPISMVMAVQHPRTARRPGLWSERGPVCLSRAHPPDG